MKKHSLIIKILGARGSAPVSGTDYRVFGGATSSVRVIAEGDGRILQEELYLDAGSGIISAVPEKNSSIAIFFSHLHLDHIQGLPVFRALSERGRNIDIYALRGRGLEIEETFERVFSEPFWPCSVHEYPAKVAFHEVLPVQNIGKIKVESLEIPHPGGSLAYKLTYGESSFVYATDFEHMDNGVKELKDFARGCALMLYDSHFTMEEYELHRGYGHSTPESGLRIAADAGVERILFTHHSPMHTDEFLINWEKEIKRINPNASFAREGEVIEV